MTDEEFRKGMDIRPAEQLWLPLVERGKVSDFKTEPPLSVRDNQVVEAVLERENLMASKTECQIDLVSRTALVPIYRDARWCGRREVVRPLPIPIRLLNGRQMVK